MQPHIAILTRLGAIDQLGDAARSVNAPLLAAVVICVIGALVSAFASTIGILGALIPLAVPLLLPGGGLEATGLIYALAISASLVDCAPFSTTGATIDGRVRAIAGGVRLATLVGTEPSRADKSLMQAPHKAAIAREAVRLLRDDMVVYLDAGTTTHALAARLDGLTGLTIVTNDFGIVEEAGLRGIDTVHVGGQVEHENRSSIGIIAATTLRGLNVDLAVISASSWSSRHGVTTPSPGKVEVKVAAMESASASVLVADSSKYGSFSMYRVAGLQGFSSIVTDDALPAGAVDSVRQLGVDLVLAADE